MFVCVCMNVWIYVFMYVRVCIKHFGIDIKSTAIRHLRLKGLLHHPNDLGPK